VRAGKVRRCDDVGKTKKEGTWKEEKEGFRGFEALRLEGFCLLASGFWLLVDPTGESKITRFPGLQD